LEARGGIEPPNKGFADLHRAPATSVESARISRELDLRPVSVRSTGSTSVPRSAKPPAFWWKIPDIETALMELRPAELRCYLVVVRSIQRDQWGGMISLRQVGTRAKLGIRHARTALDSIVAKGLLERETRTKAMPRYSLPNTFAKRRLPPIRTFAG
jgi:hypothetical protein